MRPFVYFTPSLGLSDNLSERTIKSNFQQLLPERNVDISKDIKNISIWANKTKPYDYICTLSR